MQKKEYILGEAGEALGGGALGPGAVLVTFGLFLLPGGRPGRCFAGANDDDPTAAGTVLFLLPRGQPRPRGIVGGPRSRRDPSALAMWKSGKKKTLDGKEDDAAEEELV
jgi:hypothetical protein